MYQRASIKEGHEIFARERVRLINFALLWNASMASFPVAAKDVGTPNKKSCPPTKLAIKAAVKSDIYMYQDQF